MYIANGLIILGFMGYFILILFNSKKKFSDSDGFNVTKDILSKYNQITIIENKKIFTTYNLKRKVIKIASKCYYGNSLSDIGIPLMEAGISAIDDKDNKYLNIIRKIFNNLKILYLFPLFAILVNSITFTLGDARISTIVVSLFGLISYVIIEIKNRAYLWLDANLGKVKVVEKDRALSFINRLIMADKLIFFGELLMIIRFMMIIFNIN